MKFSKLLTIVIALATVFTACEKEEEKEPVVTKISVGGLWKAEYLEGDTIKFGDTYLEVEWSNKKVDIYNIHNFAENGIETIPQRGEPIPLDQDSLYIIYKEMNFKKGIAINVIEKTVTDYDGNEYSVIKIYDQYWLDKNMATTHYADGTPIPTVIDLDGDGDTYNEWDNLGDNTEAYCYYNDEELSKRYGALYTWIAAMGGEAIKTNQGVCPEGFHVPSYDEWDELYSRINNDSDLDRGVGVHLISKEGWINGGNEKDTFNFKAFPGGHRFESGSYYGLGKYGAWWTSSVFGKNNPSYTAMYNDLYDDYRFHYVGSSKNDARSVRCIRDSEQ